MKKKRDLKRKTKKSLKTRKNFDEALNRSRTAKKPANRPVLDGVSIFDLIMPWRVEL
jgi:hypothetical protein